MAKFKVAFESTGFTDDKSIPGAICTENEAQGFTEAALKECLFPTNVLGVLGGLVSADDNQGDSNIRVFVSVTLLVDAETKEKAKAMLPPEDVLTRIADMMGTDFTGEISLSLEDRAWKVVDVEALQLESENGADQVVSMTLDETRAILSNPHGLRLLMDHVDFQYCQAESMLERGQIEPWPTKRWTELREKGRSIIAEDMDLWDDDIMRAFGFEAAGA